MLYAELVGELEECLAGDVRPVIAASRRDWSSSWTNNGSRRPPRSGTGWRASWA